MKTAKERADAAEEREKVAEERAKAAEERAKVAEEQADTVEEIRNKLSVKVIELIKRTSDLEVRLGIAEHSIDM